jgi:hypothetical protein
MKREAVADCRSDVLDGKTQLFRQSAAFRHWTDTRNRPSEWKEGRATAQGTEGNPHFRTRRASATNTDTDEIKSSAEHGCGELHSSAMHS